MAKVRFRDVLNTTGRPYVIQCTADGDALSRRISATSDCVQPREIDFHGCTKEEDLFAAVIRGLSMPYSQLNWDGFDEAMCDLSWIETGSINIVILNGVFLYRHNPNLFQRFVSSLDAIGAEWAKPATEGESWDRPPRALHVLFSSDRKSDLPLPLLDINL
ncbi:barstar family protein [Neorhizobium sp. T25_13]|uniref:barstar family protein n=1 Tax=Neorhizobium sp. T25_13 TaxID=2093830 RepID=UPI000CFA53F1|nr:barstar family protein [Neorhizobium sp. T25_13]